MAYEFSAMSLTTTRLDMLAGLDADLADAERVGRQCEIDLSDTAIAGSASPSAVRLDPASVLVVSNLLVGRYRSVPIRLTLPSNAGLTRQLARGGLFFALSNRQVQWAGHAPATWAQDRARWQRPFHPCDSSASREMFPRGAADANQSWVAAYQRYLFSVVQPHKRPARTLREDLRRIAVRWLTSRLDDEHKRAYVSTMSDVAEAFYELTVNIPDHAELKDRDSGLSLAQISVTSGGGEASHNRVQLAILDNGIGLARKVQRQYLDSERSATDAVRDAVTGALPRRDGGRGVGLSSVRHIAQEFEQGDRSVGGKSLMRIITGGDDKSSATDLSWPSDEGDPSMRTVEGLPIEGTIAWVSLGLGADPSVAPTDEAPRRLALGV